MRVNRRLLTDALIGVVIFLLCLSVYIATLTPSLSYASPDGNELATVSYILGLAHSTGYPLYTWLGKLFTFLPVGDVAYRVNLMSAVLGAGGVSLLYGILRALTGGQGPVWTSRLASAFVAVLFGLSRTFWSQTTIAEVYAPNLFMLALSLALLLWWARVEERERQGRPVEPGWRRLVPSWRALALLAGFGLCFGLSLGTHMSNLGFAPAFVLFILLVGPWTAVSPIALAAAGMGFGLGLLQFAWLPLRAHTLLDAPMRANAPTTLRGIYAYTLGAFPQFRFAFPLAALPERIVIYLHFLVQQFGILGVLGGIGGMGVLLGRGPRRFFLVVGMYLVHVWFFIQYRVFDLDVFFIPAHLLYAVFIGCGVWQCLTWLAGLRRSWPRLAVVGVAVLALTLGLVGQARTNWAVNDRSGDTAVNDFYENVLQMLPQDAVLLNRGGVFGYDLFYYRLVYDARPDVVMPALDSLLGRTELAGREIYSTSRLNETQGARGPWAPPTASVPADSWSVPVLVGETGAAGGRGLTLYHITEEPPDLVVTEAQPQHLVDRRVGDMLLVGYDLESEAGWAGGVLHVTLYWRLDGPARGLLAGLALGGDVLELHEPGFGNLARYVERFQPPRDGVLVEDYRVVIPRGTETGTAQLEVVAALLGEGGVQELGRAALQEVVVLAGPEPYALAGAGSWWLP